MLHELRPLRLLFTNRANSSNSPESAVRNMRVPECVADAVPILRNNSGNVGICCQQGFGSTCIDITTDPNNCGGCAISCGGGIVHRRALVIVGSIQHRREVCGDHSDDLTLLIDDGRV